MYSDAFGKRLLLKSAAGIQAQRLAEEEATRAPRMQRARCVLTCVRLEPQASQLVLLEKALEELGAELHNLQDSVGLCVCEHWLFYVARSRLTAWSAGLKADDVLSVSQNGGPSSDWSPFGFP